MIRFLLPALLVLLGSCQGAYQSADATKASMSESADCAAGMDSSDCADKAAMDCSDCEDGKACAGCENAVQASLIAPDADCSASDCSTEASADCQMVVEDCDAGDCSSASGTQVALTLDGDACAMKAAGVCEEGEGECPMQAAGNMECSEKGSEDCSKSKAAAGATEVSLQMDGASCAMKAAGICEEGKGECPMQASGNMECSEMGSENCSKSEAAAGATEVSLTEMGACSSKASSECAEKAAAACGAKASAESATKVSAECAEKAAAGCAEKAASECGEKGASEAPAAVQTGATAEPVKEEVPPCCSSKKVNPSS